MVPELLPPEVQRLELQTQRQRRVADKLQREVVVPAEGLEVEQLRLQLAHQLRVLAEVVEQQHRQEAADRPRRRSPNSAKRRDVRDKVELLIKPA